MKHPEIKVELVGKDGNAFLILGLVMRALREGGVSEEEVAQFEKEATSGDYNHLIITVMNWVEVI